MRYFSIDMKNKSVTAADLDEVFDEVMDECEVKMTRFDHTDKNGEWFGGVKVSSKHNTYFMTRMNINMLSERVYDLFFGESK